MKKKIQVSSRPCPLCKNDREIFVQIMANEELFNKLKMSWVKHAEISAKIIKEMVEKGLTIKDK